MFNTPEAFGILPYKHYYTPDGQPTITAYFVPSIAIAMIDGGMDDRGVTISSVAKEYYQKKRDKYANDPQGYIIHCSEYCWTPEEALSRKGENIFNQELIAIRLTDINVHRLAKPPKVGIVDYVGSENGSSDMLRFIPSPNGHVQVFEEPIRDDNGNHIKNLYVAGIDSIDQGLDQSTGQKDTSDFCLVVKKRTFGLSGDKYVCIYKFRPYNIKEAYNQAIKILEWYNCQAVLESSRNGIVNHFKERKKQHLLMKRPGVLTPSDKKTNTAMYGVYPSKQTIEYYLELIADYLLEYYQRIDSVDMLNELRDYSYVDKRKYDIVAACGMCEIGDQEMKTWGGIGETIQRVVIKPIGYYTDANGIRRYGKIPSDDPIPDELKELLKRTRLDTYDRIK